MIPVDGMEGVLLNWKAGWMMILAAFVSGAGIGLFFHNENFWGGYGSFRRRIVRLGHIALAALGMMNILYALTPEQLQVSGASALFMIGGITMPAVCFLTGWRMPFRHLFFIPVLSLTAAVGLILIGGF
jgi:hypothetical protein